ncbi:MAG TPA: hypothetical protein VFS97_10980, partial [Nitrososphaeraceae archaeon]|nr:hypothetical protein [Nitrososphaeraceae archaeon]
DEGSDDNNNGDEGSDDNNNCDEGSDDNNNGDEGSGEGRVQGRGASGPADDYDGTADDDQTFSDCDGC